MKKFVFLIGLLFGLCWSGSAQAFLNHGESYGYTFTSLPFVEVRNYSEPQLPIGRITIAGLTHQWQQGDLLRLDLFESEIGLTPIQTSLIPFALEPNLAVGQGYPFAWQDLQGSVRVSADGGPVTLEKIILETFVPTDSTRRSLSYYRLEFTPVPEPSTMWLLLVSVGVIYVRGGHKKSA